MRLITTVFAVCLAADQVRAEEVCPDTPELPVSVSAKVVKDLTGWIALHTSYDVSKLYDAPPTVSFCHVGDMIEYEASTILVEPFLSAAYNLPHREIFLVAPWSEQDPYDRSVLLHELIHDVQLSNRAWACVGAPEMEAYLLQAKYLEEHGIVPDFDWPSIYVLSRCPKAD